MELSAFGRVSLKRAYQELEDYRQIDVQREVESRAKIMKTNIEKSNSLYQLKKQAINQNLLEECFRKDEELLKLMNEDLKNNEQKSQILEQLKERSQLKQNHLKCRMQLLDSIIQKEMEFNAVHRNMVQTFQGVISDDNYKALTQKVTIEQRNLTNMMITIVEKCKYQPTEEDYTQVCQIVQRIKDLMGFLLADMKRISLTSSIEKEAAVAPVAVAVAVTIPQQSASLKCSTEQQMRVPETFLQTYKSAIEFLRDVGEKCTEISKSKSLNQLKFNLKKAINIPLNSLSTVNSHHLAEKYLKLRNLLSGETVEVGNTRFTANEHPQGVLFCKDLLAKMFVTQGEFVVSRNPESAFGYASVLIALWTDFPDLGPHIMAHFYQQCPYLIPHFPHKLKTESEVDYLTKLGYKILDDNKIEDQDKFLQRISGITKLFATMSIIKPKRAQINAAHPFNVNNVWGWFSNFLNVSTKNADLCATLLHDFFEITSYQMSLRYRRQFAKIVSYAKNVYLPQLKKINNGGPVTRLEQFLNRNEFHPPKGQMPDNFW